MTAFLLVRDSLLQHTSTYQQRNSGPHCWYARKQ